MISGRDSSGSTAAYGMPGTNHSASNFTINELRVAGADCLCRPPAEPQYPVSAPATARAAFLGRQRSLQLCLVTRAPADIQRDSASIVHMYGNRTHDQAVVLSAGRRPDPLQRRNEHTSYVR